MLKLNSLSGFGSGVSAGADGASYDFDGDGDYLTVPDHADWDFWSSDFTVEAFIYLTSIDNGCIFTQRVDSSNRIEFLYTMAPRDLRLTVKIAATAEVDVRSNAGVIVDNTWHHVMVVRSSDTYYIFVDGVDQTTSGSPDSYNPAGLAGPIYIGRRGGGALQMNGHIDELRVSNVARHTSGFTSPSAQYTSDANTVLLIHGGEDIASGTTGSGATFVDSGNTGHTVTEVGDAIRNTSIVKF